MRVSTRALCGLQAALARLCVSLNARSASSDDVSKTAPPMTISSRMAYACMTASARGSTTPQSK